MVKIPLIRRQQKTDSAQLDNGKGKDGKSKEASRFGKDQPMKPAGGKDGRKGALPASPPAKDEDSGQYVLGTNKKIPLPGRTPKQEVPEWQSPAANEPTESPFVARVLMPEPQHEPDELTREPEEIASEMTAVGETALVEPPAEQAEVTQTSPTVSDEETPLPQSPSAADHAKHAAETVSSKGIEDALAILKAMPDYIFRIGPAGVVPVVGNGSGFCAISELGQPSDAEAAAQQAEKLEFLENMLIEELGRQSEAHTRKVLETKKLQTFEFQVRADKELHYLEARLMPFGEGDVLAIVRDVTLMRQTQNALVESRNELENHLKERNTELIRVNKMLKTEVELREEQEEILKKNFRRLEALVDETVGAITLIVERKDPHVADHQRRVCSLACAIAQEMNSRNDRMRAVRMAAQLHDLGKIFIPAEILRKPGKLTDAEMSVIKTHPDTDYQILKRINFPISIADVVRQHHERLDGSGYPQGLKGDAILIEAQILAVADVIEGMIFERPYRVAPGLEAALKEIAENKGRLYYPAVADACLRLFAEKRFQFEGMPEQETPVAIGTTPDRRDF